MVNLYGMFPKEKLLKVYNEQNSEQVSMDDIEAFMTDKFSMIPGTFAFPYEDYFAHEVIVMYGEFDELLAQKGSKPYYVPKKKEDRKSTRLNSSHVAISYAVFCLK